MRTKTIELIDEEAAVYRLRVRGAYLRNGKHVLSPAYVSICRATLEHILPEVTGCHKLFVKAFTYEPTWHTVQIKKSEMGDSLLTNGHRATFITSVRNQLENMIRKSKSGAVYVQVWYE